MTDAPDAPEPANDFAPASHRTSWLILCGVIGIVLGWLAYDVLFVRQSARRQQRRVAEIAAVGTSWQTASQELKSHGYETYVSSTAAGETKNIVTFKPARYSHTLRLAWKLANKLDQRQLYMNLFGVTTMPEVDVDATGIITKVTVR